MKIQVTAGAMIFLAVLLLVLPIQWVVAVLLAAVIHECCHAAAVYLLGSSIERISIGRRGIVMEVRPMSAIREIACAMAGPLGSILLLTLAPKFPRTAICGLVHGLYNLIPLFPLDGGRVLRSFLYGMFRPPLARKIYIGVQWGVVVLLLIGCAVLTLRIGILPLVFGMLVLRHHLNENPLAKRSIWRYNRSTIDKEVQL